MTKMFTRTITTFEATAFVPKWDMAKGVGKLEEVGRAQYVAASTNNTEARAALKAAGVPVKKGMQIRIEKVSEEVYGMTIEQFMAHAQLIDRNTVENEQ